MNFSDMLSLAKLFTILPYTFAAGSISRSARPVMKSTVYFLLFSVQVIISGGLSFYWGSSKHLKSPKSLEIRAFRQKESTAILIPIVSKLRCFFAE